MVPHYGYMKCFSIKRREFRDSRWENQGDSRCFSIFVKSLHSCPYNNTFKTTSAWTRLTSFLAEDEHSWLFFFVCFVVFFKKGSHLWRLLHKGCCRSSKLLFTFFVSPYYLTFTNKYSILCLCYLLPFLTWVNICVYCCKSNLFRMINN